MFKLVGTLFSLGVLASGGWWVWNNVPEARNFIEARIDSQGFHTLEVRHTADQIMQAHADELLKDEAHSFRRPTLLFQPYLLMEVKYTGSSGNTNEGVILWSLESGEMVVDATTWEMTHGFQDCINAKASRNDFRVLTALADNHTSLRRDALAEKLHVDLDIVDTWLDSCRQKKLIVQCGGNYRLHFQNPRLSVSPQTHLNQRLVTKPYKHAERIPRRYSIHQIEALAQCAFGNDFTIRHSKEVYLPVYSIVVQNPDGTRLTSYWNALNGKPLEKSIF